MDSLEERLLKTLDEAQKAQDQLKQTIDSLADIRPTDEEEAKYTVPPDERATLQAQSQAGWKRAQDLKEEIKNLYQGSWALKIESFIKTIWAWAKAGFKISDLHTKRYSICQSCPHLKNERCTLCGCYMKAKSKIPQAACPIAKWKAEVPKESKNTK